MFKKISKDELVRGSFVLIITMGLFNFFNYIFQMSMAKMLGPIDYGVFAVLMSFMYIFTIPSEAIQTIVAKYTSKLNTKKSYGKIKDLLIRSIKKAFILSLILFAIFIIISYLFLAEFFKIKMSFLVLTGITLIFCCIMPVTRGILQGQKKFSKLGFNMIFESIIKIIASVSFVIIGFSVYGAIGGVLTGSLVAFTYSFFLIKEITSSKRIKEKFHGIYSYSIPGLIAITCIVLMYSLDIILARRFFSPELAGQYAFVSLIGKVIVFINLAIGKAMFPLSSEQFEKGAKTQGLFKKSIILVSLTAIFLLFFYFFFPEQVIRIVSLGSTQYLAASNVLFILGLAFAFNSFSNIIILYNLSINRMKKSSFFLLSFVFLEILMLSIFHSNIREFAIALMITNLLMFLYSLKFIRK